MPQRTTSTAQPIGDWKSAAWGMMVPEGIPAVRNPMEPWHARFPL